jgi:hypothetical protein
MKPTASKKHLLPAAVMLLSALKGGAILALLFSQHSEAQNAVFMGFSRTRLAIGAAVIGAALVLLAGGLLLLSPSRRTRLIGWLQSRLTPTQPFLALFTGILAAALEAVAWNEILASRLFGLAQLRPVLIWLALILLQVAAAMAILLPEALRQALRMQPRQSARFLWTALLPSALLAGTLFIGTRFDVDLLHFRFFFAFVLAGLAFLAGLGWLEGWARERPWYASARSYLIAAVIFCLVFAVYRLSAVMVGNIVTPSKSYFDELARAWLDGRLYLINPSDTHDLTLYNGQWYVANPPLVAILMVPLVWLIDDFNTVVYAAVNGALNAALLFLLLEWVARRGWTRLRTGGHLWLTAFFAFGTAHYYLSTVGRMWFMSQTITVTLLLLAASLAVTRRPAWLSGAAVALAVVARPHILVFAPLLLGIAVQNAREDGRKFNFASLVRWGLAIGVPFLLAVGGLLFYNWLRFADPLDYGYLTENVADFMASDLHAYGTFHPVFILRNLRVMFLNLPHWREPCNAFGPSVEGMSMLLVSPALLYLAGALPLKRAPERRKAWVIGAWAAILTTLVPLALYYNTGAWQFGYKYLLDFLVPVMLLLALAAGQRPAWGMRLLILVSMVVNLYGVLWWFGVVCR